MSSAANHITPPASTRFRKGQSGNPRGRPRKQPDPQSSAFDVVIDRTLTIVQDGVPREVTVDEALQHKTYQDAIAGAPSLPGLGGMHPAGRLQGLAGRADVKVAFPVIGEVSL